MGERVDDCLDGESRSIPIENADDDPSSRVASPESCVIPILQDQFSISADAQVSVPPSPTLSDSPKEEGINFEDGNLFHSSNFLQNAEETTKLLEAFTRAKETAVKVEDFYFAKILKTSMTIMEKGAEEVTKLDALKKQVVREEDYDSAARYKSQIEAIKSTVRDKIVDEGIEVDDNGEITLIDPDIADIVGLADTRPTPSESQTYSPRGSLSNGKASPRDTPNTSPRSSLSGKHNSIGMTRTDSSHSMTRNPSNGSAIMSRTDRDDYSYQSHGRDELAAGSIQRSMSRKRSPSPLNIPKIRTNSNASNSNRHASTINKHHDLDYAFGTSANSSAQVSPVSSEKTHSWTAVEDERPLPALEKVKPPVMPLPFEDELVDNEPEQLSDLARSAFAWSIDVFGDRVIACLLSKKFKLRESALFEVTRLIDIEKGVGLTIDEKIDKMALIRATFQVMEEGLSDTREKLILQSIKLWDAITKFCVLHKTPNSATYKTVEQTYPKLFAKVADGNPRLKQAASDLFVILCTNYRTPNQMLMSHMLKPALTQTQPPKQAKAKIELVMRLVDEFGVALVPKGKFDKDSAISLEGVMEVAVSYLNHSNGDVRDSATKLAALVCRYTEKENVEKYLEGVKPLLLETIWKLVQDQGPNRRRRPRQAQKAPPTMFELDEALLEKPLAKRGTVSRLQQQLMEVRAMVNNVNHFVQDDYDAYLANSTKLLRHENADVVQASPAVVEKAPVEPKDAPQAVEKVTPEKKSSSAKTTKSTKSAPVAKKTSGKKKVESSRSAVQPKTGSKSREASTSARGTASKVPSRRGSAGEKSSSTRPSTKTTARGGDSTSKASEDAGEDVKADGFCIFCDEQNDDFTEENLMTHYWNDCPVLTKCPLCNIILEISTLDDHMLTDCDKSKFVKQCPRCREVIPADSYLEHIAKQTCMLIPPQIVRCPLCKTVVRPATEAGWKAHLLDEEGCPKNIRKSTPTEKKLDKVDETSKEKKDKSKTSPVGGSKTSGSSAKVPTRKSSGIIGKDKARKPSARGGKLKSGV